MNTTLKILVAALVLSNFLAATAQSKDCSVATSWICDPNECKAAPNSILIKIDVEKKLVSRCDEKGCDSFGFELSQSGVMSNLFNGDKGYLLKLNNSDQRFVEVATLATVVLVKYGKCLPD